MGMINPAAWILAEMHRCDKRSALQANESRSHNSIENPIYSFIKDNYIDF